MKKIIYIISILSIVLILGCNSNTDSKSDSAQSKQAKTTEEIKDPIPSKEEPEIKKSVPEKTDNIFEGMYTYMADANMFVSCDKKIKMSVAMKGEYLNLERQYLRTVDGGVEVYVKLKGSIKKVPSMEGDQKIDALFIDEVLELSKDRKCP